MRHNIATSFKLSRKPRVCIVGAGFSGLICAERLGRQGVDVTVVEARDRCGGRVHQTNLIGHWTDMGANWIHGAHVNPIRDLARKVHAVTLEVDEATNLFDEDGKQVPQEVSEKLEAVVWGIIEEAFQYSSSDYDIPPSKSLYDFVEHKSKEKGLSESDRRTVLQMAAMWGGYIGTPYDRQNLKYLFLEASLEEIGENSFLASTYRDILRVVESEAAKQAPIYLGTEVINIDAGPTGVHIKTRTTEYRSKHMPSLRPSDDYDAVVVTTPFGCLKERQINYSPALPAEFELAIDSITYGNLEKVYIRFPEAFWLSSDNEHPFFTHFLHPRYTSQNPGHWDIGMVSLASASEKAEQTSHPTILFYVYGPCGTHVTNLITGLDHSDPLYRQRLTQFFEPYYSKLPGYKAQDSRCEPVAVLATDWQHDRLAGHGSYTNWQIDDNAKHGLPPKMPLDEAILTLRKGLPERRVWFAGEHTAPFAALGTVTGAYLSGEAVAQIILEYFTEPAKDTCSDE